MTVDEKYVEIVRDEEPTMDKEDYDELLEEFGIEADFKPLSENGIDLQGYTITTLSEMYQGDELTGRPVVSNVYITEFTNKNTGETTVNPKIDLVLLDDTYEEEKEAYVFPINLKSDENIQKDISNMSGLYMLMISIMELRAKGISNYYNNLKKVELDKMKRLVESYKELTVEVMEKSFKNKRTDEETIYNSFKVISGVKKQK